MSATIEWSMGRGTMDNFTSHVLLIEFGKRIPEGSRARIGQMSQDPNQPSDSILYFKLDLGVASVAIEVTYTLSPDATDATNLSRAETESLIVGVLEHQKERLFSLYTAYRQFDVNSNIQTWMKERAMDSSHTTFQEAGGTDEPLSARLTVEVEVRPDDFRVIGTDIELYLPETLRPEPEREYYVLPDSEAPLPYLCHIWGIPALTE